MNDLMTFVILSVVVLGISTPAIEDEIKLNIKRKRAKKQEEEMFEKDYKEWLKRERSK